ncbi:hypothetical protein OTK49_26580 [Vibrio coralliirubri]|uniref:hypothetical protein n=1 Tax=Vibrio coralliirubri TaxID=1516159 RepID=UPI002284C040|nr:hypothetical protein [Vibrio coralliirubri]MCY9866107.1 hypothetical protein [Vibrio coralliirubri]
MSIDNVQKALADLGIKRIGKEKTIGKKVGEHVWVHKDYAELVCNKDKYQMMSAALPSGFSYDVVRVSQKVDEVAFIRSPDFNTSHEPIVSDSIRVTLNADGELSVSKATKEQKDPLIYHHKWLFVQDDYKGFDVEEAKLRSLEWKSKLGVDRVVSSKIGRCSFWDNWLKQNSIGGRHHALAKDTCAVMANVNAKIKMKL